MSEPVMRKLHDPVRTKEQAALDVAVAALRKVGGGGYYTGLPPTAKWRAEAADAALAKIDALLGEERR